jgi:hypothetical protein
MKKEKQCVEENIERKEERVQGGKKPIHRKRNNSRERN